MSHTKACLNQRWIRESLECFPVRFLTGIEAVIDLFWPNEFDLLGRVARVVEGVIKFRVSQTMELNQVFIRSEIQKAAGV